MVGLTLVGEGLNDMLNPVLRQRVFTRVDLPVETLDEAETIVDPEEEERMRQ